MTNPIDDLDQWLRRDFIHINTQLEEAYFVERVDVISGRSEIDTLKRQLAQEGGLLIERVAAMPSPPPETNAGYRLLGLIGHYLAACQRHEVGPANSAAWHVSMRIGRELGVAPRLVFAHQSLFNDAIGGRIRTFTSLPDEEVFIRFNALGVLAYRRAANALRGIADMGVANPVSAYLFDDAEAALDDVLRFSRELTKQLNVDRFYFNIRPYFKTYRVGQAEYRGANAGDFAAINEIDVNLGLCRMDDLFYESIVYEKLGHVPPDDQRVLRTLGHRHSLLHAFLRELDLNGGTPEWQANARRFLKICRAHAAAYAYHHQRLVKPYIEVPAQNAPSAHKAGITSSGPPLDEVIATLRHLLDLRTARNHPDMARLQAAAFADQCNAKNV